MTTLALETPRSVQLQPPPLTGLRLTSIDAYRGFVMFLMMAEVLSFSDVAAARPGNPFWHFLAYNQSHVPWVGCSLHDLIQPSFSFLVGVALPFSLANRLARGQSRNKMIWHALWRAVVLILLGVFLRSTHSTQTNWTFEDTLTQIGLGYFFLFLLALRPARDQWLVFAAILAGYWLAFALYPLPNSDFDYSQAGVSKDWPHMMTGFAAHWNKNTNLAWAFDNWFLNLFPRKSPFHFNDGGYSTLSVIPTLATLLLGLIAGSVLRDQRAPASKVRWFVMAGLIGLIGGSLFGWLGICPVVKRIWTPSWTLFSGGWCLLILAAFYSLTDLRGWRGWVFPLVVIGTNSIAAYCIDHLFDSFISRNLTTHLGAGIFGMFGPAYEPLFHGALVLVVFWLLLLWMYRRKIFLRI
jgi:heparan-alpha-glucosaminide N-acetyltransferase